MQDEIEAIRKEERIYRKADEFKKSSNPDAVNIAAIYEKFSLRNVEIGLENRRRIRASIVEDNPAPPANNQKSDELLPVGFLKRLGQRFHQLFGSAKAGP